MEVVDVENFKFAVEADIFKSVNPDTQEEVRLIRGYASTSAEDRQDESIVQKGLDISEFVSHGFFNYDHDNSIVMGYPTENCRIDDNGFWVEGILLKGIPHADRMWELAKALKKSSAPRKLGFSVEGKVLERDGGRILKAKIYHVAITASPVNPTCSWEAIVKGFEPAKPLTSINTVSKALETSYETNPNEMEGGTVLTKESLAGSLKNLADVMTSDKKKKLLKEQLSGVGLNKSELTVYLQLTTGWSRSDTESFISSHNL